MYNVNVKKEEKKGIKEKEKNSSKKFNFTYSENSKY